MTKETYLKEMMVLQSGSVKAFSVSAKIPYTTIRSILERGIGNASITSIIAICEALGITTEQLITFDENELNILSIYNKLEINYKKDVYTYAENKLDEQKGIYPMFETINVYGHASAGTGAILDDNENIEEVTYTGTVPKHDYALYVDGDSMLPLFSNGQVIFVKKTVEAYSNQIVIANVNGEGYVKKFVTDENGVRLISLNKKYKDIQINESDDFRIMGVVIL